MRAIIAVAFFDTVQNERHKSTIKTLEKLQEQVGDPHVVIPVDNGSEDLTALDWLEEHWQGEYLRLDTPGSTADGNNAAWSRYHDALSERTAVAVKFDSDIVVDNDDWLDKMLAVVEADEANERQIGLLGMRNPREKTGPPYVIEDHGAWWHVRFVYGAVSMRTPAGWWSIGYSEQPYGRWGWDDHWDCFRIQRAGLKLATLSDVIWRQISTKSCLSEEAKSPGKGGAALIEMCKAVKDGERGILVRRP